MAKQRSQKSKYPSRYSPRGWVTEAQYITELVCENKAQKNKTDLPIKFWNLKEWEKFYKSQIWTANRLLKKYSAKAIITALKNQKHTFSLRAPWLEKEIIKQQKILDSKVAQPKNVEPLHEKPKVEVKFRTKRNSGGLLSTLKEEDGKTKDTN